MQADGLPSWVQDEIWNWSRWCWLGDLPHPMPMTTCASGERAFPSGMDRDEEEEAPPQRPVPVNHDRARRVEQIYQALPLIERRAIQAEYPRRNEYGEATKTERHTKAARNLAISVASFRDVIDRFKQKVWREFR